MSRKWLAVGLLMLMTAGCGQSELTKAKADADAATAYAAADGVDMAVKLAYLDKVDPAEVPEYVSLMDSLEAECSESREMIGGMARGMMKQDIEQGYESDHYDSMLTMQDMLLSWDAPRPVECIEILNYYRQSTEE